MGLRPSVGPAFGASWLIAPPVGLAAGLAIQERNVLALFDSNADSGATIAMLLMSYLITFFGLITVGLPITAILEKGGGNALVKVGLAGTSIAFFAGASVTDVFVRLPLITAGLTSAIFAAVYLLFGSDPAHVMEPQQLD